MSGASGSILSGWNDFRRSGISHARQPSAEAFWRLSGAVTALDRYVVTIYETYLGLIGNEPLPGWDAEAKDTFLGEVDLFHRTVLELELAEQILVPALQILCDKRIKEHVSHCLANGNTPGAGDKGKRHLDVTSFHSLSSFLHNVFQQDTSAECAPLDLITSLILEYATQEYIHAVIESFFDLLLQWPKSRQSFMELKELMDHTSQDVVHGIIVSLQRQFHCKLLRPGLNTLDILAVYTAAIRALRIIDPSRVIQDLVCEPVRVYLRSRPDTVRCIMSHITHISSSRDLYHRKTTLPALDVMIEEEEAVIAQMQHNIKSAISDIDMENWKTWMPDPIYAELLPSSARTDRQADTIELLMSIYGGQDVFINEYQLILAEKLLGYYSFDSEEESKHLKMMTKRYSENLLQRSDVMSRDAADSQKFHQKILERLELGTSEKRIPLGIPVSALVISHNYWPEIRTEKLRVPTVLESAMLRYKQYFEEISLTRTVDSRPELGHVNFDLILDDGRKMNIKCNPVYAAIILKFVEQPRWPMDDLAEAVGISASLLKRKLNYWQRRNVLEESEPDVFSIVAEGSFLSEEDLRRMEDEEIESAVRYVAENNQDEQNVHIQLQMFWKYMTTVLNNVPTITIDRLFSMIRMFIIRGQTKKDVTIDHLRQYLDAKVRARELVFSNNRYSLPKKEATAS
ncbi:anaphase-promoting complex subunit 2-like [Paramacrobiotus metropolitanus]|uniref:anaphase-promoting complex subunit 2-like n=1 Tax=Paramacrobiotus metropolitanus TaxID=2943436 RepID=UPI002445EE63|nr:anaphase-promoting complex subunit 2-like [Paramacrobiotus metropolitanus]